MCKSHNSTWGEFYTNLTDNHSVLEHKTIFIVICQFKGAIYSGWKLTIWISLITFHGTAPFKTVWGLFINYVAQFWKWRSMIYFSLKCFTIKSSLHWLNSHFLYAILVQWSILPRFYRIPSPSPQRHTFYPPTPTHILSTSAFINHTCIYQTRLLLGRCCRTDQKSP